MKKFLSMVLTLVLCLSLCACGGPVKLTEEKITNALANCEGTLNLESSGRKVVAFTYVVEEVNAEELVDRSYTYKAVAAATAGKTSQMTYNQFEVVKAFTPLLAIDVLVTGGEETDLDATMDRLLGIICDGNTENYDGWKVSAVVDQENNSLIIKVVSEEANNK